MKVKKSGMFLKILAFLFCIYCVFTIIKLQIDINAKSKEVASLQKQIEEKISDNKRIESIINSEIDKELVEKIAREKLGLGHNGEIVFVDAGEN